MAQPVKHPTLDLSSDLDLRAVGSRSTFGCTLGVESTLKKKKVNTFEALTKVPVAW